MATAVIVAARQDGELCKNGTETKWRTGGIVERCVDKTRYGADCVFACKQGGHKAQGTEKDYYWCWTGWHLSGDWDYCGLEGKTRYGVQCATECAQNGKDYWWCYTSHDSEGSPTSWEYCSPPSKVKVSKATYTRYGQICNGDCDTHGEEYWWCEKSRRWGGKSADSPWDFCSPQNTGTGSQSSPVKGEARTRYNKPCKDACEGRGEDYFWCNTLDNSWDYCSPKVVAAEPVIAKGGRPCAGICDTMGKSYKWCSVTSVTDPEIKGDNTSSSWSPSWWWDYCGEEYKASSSTLNAISWLPLLAALIINFVSI